MCDEDEVFTACFEQGRRAARTGLHVTSNPYLDTDSNELSAWVEGFASVENSVFIPAERAQVFHAGQIASGKGENATVCPYLDDDDPERMEIWLLGYAPHIEPEQVEADFVRPL